MSSYDLYMQKLIFLRSQKLILEEIHALCEEMQALWSRANYKHFSLIKEFNIDKKLCYFSSDEVASVMANAIHKHMSRERKKETEHETER